MLHSIRWRLVASYLALAFLLLTLMGLLAVTLVLHNVQGQEREALKANAEAVAREALRFLAHPSRRTAIQELASTASVLGDARVKVLTIDKQVIADSGAPGRADQFVWVVPPGLVDVPREDTGTPPTILSVPSRRDLLALLRHFPPGSTHLYVRRLSTPWGRRLVFDTDPPAAEPQRAARTAPMTVTVPVRDNSVTLGYVEMTAASSVRADVGPTLTRALLVSGLGSLAIALALGLLMGGTLTVPLRTLTAAAKRMAGGDLAARSAAVGSDEIGELSRQFNTMAESLEASFRTLKAEHESLKRFVADASHELRTPITALKTFNELLLGRAAGDSEARREFLRESHEQLERLEWITTNLLDLSRLEAGIAALSLGEHDAAEIIEAAAAPLRSAALQSGVALAVSAPDPGPRLVCDEERIAIALGNLLSNALAHTPQGGHVRCEVATAGGQVVFSVSDNGTGIDPEDLPHIFERFYRGRNSRAGGSGLGLAIVRSVVSAHGGTVHAESAPGAGSRFTIAIPERPASHRAGTLPVPARRAVDESHGHPSRSA